MQQKQLHSETDIARWMFKVESRLQILEKENRELTNRLITKDSKDKGKDWMNRIEKVGVANSSETMITPYL